jgi:hypothetical protein
MAAGRPHGPNDPSLMSSLETAVTEVRRPGLRVRAGCVNAWVQTRGGKLPFILATTPTAYGEQVRLWLRAGLTPADLQAAKDVLAVACWATEVRVIPSASRAQLVTLEIVRTRYPERARPTPEAWPSFRDVESDARGDTEPEGRSNAYVRDDRFERLS